MREETVAEMEQLRAEHAKEFTQFAQGKDKLI